MLAVRSGNGRGVLPSTHDPRMPSNVAVWPDLSLFLIFTWYHAWHVGIKSINQSLDSQSCNCPEVKRFTDFTKVRLVTGLLITDNTQVTLEYVFIWYFLKKLGILFCSTVQCQL